MEGFSSSKYWEERYRKGGNSGAGSYGRLAQFKGEFLKGFLSDNNLASVLEFGCGDGNQLSFIKPRRYTGFDVSPAAIEICRQKYSGVQEYDFYSTEDDHVLGQYDVTISLDVIFHLIEDDIFSEYIHNLFKHSARNVVIYSSNFNGIWPDVHVKHRNVSEFISKNIEGWHLSCIVPNAFPYKSDDVKNTSFCDFLVYSKIGCPCFVSIPGGGA